MALPSRVGTDDCSLGTRWKLDSRLASMLVELEAWAQREFAIPPVIRWPGLYVISGFRTLEENRRTPGAAPDSRHIQCPSTAVDMRVGTVSGVESAEVWAILGGRWKEMGGRWGGNFQWSGSPLPNPRESNHFDLG